MTPSSSSIRNVEEEECLYEIGDAQTWLPATDCGPAQVVLG
ncbi:hypothetical protein [Rhodococcus sp. ACPA4]|nr:hypothetical protein [Rhodococcus sp. ACPA4]